MTQSQIIYVIILSAYYTVVIVFSFRILLENKNPLKTQSYLLLMLLFPVIGMVIYLLFGINFRKKKLFSRKGFIEQKIIHDWINNYEHLLKQRTDDVREFLDEKAKLPYLFWRNNYSALTSNNAVTILNNGESKFPMLLEKLNEASDHIHIEYYIFEEGKIGDELLDLLCTKAMSGVEVRLIVDAIGSSKFRRKTIKRLKACGVSFFEYNPVIFTFLANRVNYRDHRKIAIIDGKTGFVGGINVGDKYINLPGSKSYWRDTHCMIEGEAVYSLQVLFILNWYFTSKTLLKPERRYFPGISQNEDVISSIISSDPDSDNPNLMEAFFSMITSAKDEILISTPYFIPNESILTALTTSAKGGVKVKVLLPAVADSVFVHAASMTYMGKLLRNDIEVYMYKKGMVHSKVMIIDEELSTIGTANMDYRSFDHNAEVNAVFFNQVLAKDLKTQFFIDMNDADRLDYLSWKKRPFRIKIIGSIGRLVAPLL